MGVSCVAHMAMYVGPWTGAWVRRGHDPRTDPNSLQYQTLEYVLPAEWYAYRICVMLLHARHAQWGGGAAYRTLYP